MPHAPCLIPATRQPNLLSSGRLSVSPFVKIWLAVVVIAVGMHLGGPALLDADEGRNAEVAREMAETNDYVMPRLNGLPYLDKPVVYFAAEAALMEVFGPTELAARLPAYLFTLATAAVLFWFARVCGAAGYQMLVVAIGWQLYELTGNPFDLGLIGLIQFIPAVLLVLVVGHVTDRYDRRMILVACQIIETIAAGTLLTAVVRIEF